VLYDHVFDVICVKNAVEGLREIMVMDFDVIICDTMMPHLPGSMFYFAVERVKPWMCSRFLFLMGENTDARTHSFVRRTGALTVWKPFEMHVMFETINLVIKKAGQSNRLIVSNITCISN